MAALTSLRMSLEAPRSSTVQALGALEGGGRGRGGAGHIPYGSSRAHTEPSPGCTRHKHTGALPHPRPHALAVHDEGEELVTDLNALKQARPRADVRLLDLVRPAGVCQQGASSWCQCCCWWGPQLARRRQPNSPFCERHEHRSHPTRAAFAKMPGQTAPSCTTSPVLPGPHDHPPVDDGGAARARDAVVVGLAQAADGGHAGLCEVVRRQV